MGPGKYNFSGNGVFHGVRLETLICRGVCYIKNDSPFSFSGSAFIEIVSFENSETSLVYKESNLHLDAGPGMVDFFSLTDLANLDGV